MELETLKDLPSPYEPHASGLLHLPRFIAKIRKHIAGELPKAYQRNFTKGFDGFLCLHLEIEPQVVIDLVEKYGDNEDELDLRLLEIFPEDLKVYKWNRQLTQMGMSAMGQEKLKKDKEHLGVADRDDIRSYADIIDIDEGRIDR